MQNTVEFLLLDKCLYCKTLKHTDDTQMCLILVSNYLLRDGFKLLQSDELSDDELLRRRRLFLFLRESELLDEELLELLELLLLEPRRCVFFVITSSTFLTAVIDSCTLSFCRVSFLICSKRAISSAVSARSFFRSSSSLSRSFSACLRACSSISFCM